MGPSIKLSPASSCKSNYLFRISYFHVLSGVVKNKNLIFPNGELALTFQACLQHKYQVHYVWTQTVSFETIIR